METARMPVLLSFDGSNTSKVRLLASKTILQQEWRGAAERRDISLFLACFHFSAFLSIAPKQRTGMKRSRSNPVNSSHARDSGCNQTTATSCNNCGRHSMIASHWVHQESWRSPALHRSLLLQIRERADAEGAASSVYCRVA
ncbi:hypothetical protein K437DRAFT_188427 [Tilletiaria anomala UBC 951]|uniref:Uncharacterized protein n=1 Tax=Tilletiaria anomala (strain ATCC 24038 / CBS 436.72 / UBC 951) TaxID=1037660 RepID=A0A066VPL5_TILAU|nr:uncharacterized protein K437DRAFT_188427 [Tilletiaria anomala UBC 951]KDN40525.1 hypothetical protein K437DRAFT_188427 [Tilletiaria anomala UBC 951]